MAVEKKAVEKKAVEKRAVEKSRCWLTVVNGCYRVLPGKGTERRKPGR
jgi:hypothetical protein